jgi:hypothetical protein
VSPVEEADVAGSLRRGARRPRTVLEYLLWQQDRTYEEIAADFNALAVGAGERATISARHLRRLASGERSGTTPVTRRILQAMFGRPIDELLHPPTGVDAPSRPAPGSDGLAVQKEVLGMAVERARRFGIVAGQTNLSQGSIEQFADAVHELAAAYPQQALPRLLHDVVAIQEALYTLLEGRQQPNQTRQLYFLTGVVGGLLAKASHDLADPHAALAHARTAFLCAENADHPGLRAWIRGIQALVAYWADRPLESIRYAQSGSEYAARGHNTAEVWLAVSEARAWGAVGNAAEARASIERAERARDVVQPDEVDQLGGLCTFGRSRQLYYAADALTWLPGEVESAARYATEAVAAYRDTSSAEWAFGDQAGSHADLAMARIGGGDLEGAVEAVEPVLELPVDQRMNGIITSMTRVHKALGASPLSTEARDLQERIEMFTRTPLRSIGA